MEGNADNGFTLIELSIVLVIIGLIVGGIMVGMDLINAARIRAQISQIEQYQAAVNSFRSKYNCFPGDCATIGPSQGFPARGTSSGQGDGNDVIEGWWTVASGSHEGVGETAVFWVDLSTASLISGGFSAASETNYNSANGVPLANQLPAAKLGNGFYVYVYSTYFINYFGLSSVSSMSMGSAFNYLNSPSNNGALIPAQQAYSIDQKIDDGYPQTGNVTAKNVGGGGGGVAVYWPETVQWGGGGSIYQNTVNTRATNNTSTVCFGNNNIAGAIQQYILSNNGTNATCGLSFQFQ